VAENYYTQRIIPMSVVAKISTKMIKHNLLMEWIEHISTSLVVYISEAKLNYLKTNGKPQLASEHLVLKYMKLNNFFFDRKLCQFLSYT
jgi:hypothetical protein